MSPSTTPSPATSGSLLLHGTGDVSLDPSYISTYASRGYGYGYAWSGVDGLFRRDDLTVVNLECPVSDTGSPVPKEFTFRGDPDALPAMGDTGVEVANLGNNHSDDYGPDALLDTVRNVGEAGIDTVGAGADRARALAPAMLDVILGGHSHRLQPMETYRGRPIFYSLGTFVWPNLSAEGSETAVAEVSVSPQGVFRGRLLPATITAPGRPELL